MMSLRLSSFIMLFTLAFIGSSSTVDAFVASSTPCRGPNAVIRSSSPLVMQSALDGIKEPIENYVHIWTPLFDQAREAGVPDALFHWGHGGAMATVLLTMGLIGASMGWQIRLGNGNDVTALTLGETVREAHPKIMAGALFFFLLGGQGGLVLLDFQRPKYFGISPCHDGGIGDWFDDRSSHFAQTVRSDASGPGCSRLSRIGHNGCSFCPFGDWSQVGVVILETSE